VASWLDRSAEWRWSGADDRVDGVDAGATRTDHGYQAAHVKRPHAERQRRHPTLVGSNWARRSCPIWRAGCQVDGVHGSVLAEGWGTEMWLRLAGRSGRPRMSRRWSASYAGAGYPKTLVSSHVRCLFSSAAARVGGCSWARRGLVCAMPGSSGRLASRDGCRSGVQSEALILLVVVDLGFCGTEEACVRGSPAGMDAGGMRSG
jgi:hypothetical protein